MINPRVFAAMGLLFVWLFSSFGIVSEKLFPVLQDFWGDTSPGGWVTLGVVLTSSLVLVVGR